MPFFFFLAVFFLNTSYAAFVSWLPNCTLALNYKGTDLVEVHSLHILAEKGTRLESDQKFARDDLPGVFSNVNANENLPTVVWISVGSEFKGINDFVPYIFSNHSIALAKLQGAVKQQVDRFLSHYGHATRTTCDVDRVLGMNDLIRDLEAWAEEQCFTQIQEVEIHFARVENGDAEFFTTAEIQTGLTLSLLYPYLVTLRHFHPAGYVFETGFVRGKQVRAGPYR